MRRTQTLTAGGAALAGLGLLAGLAIGSGENAVPVPRTPPVEVRTEMIRKTVHVYRREHPRHGSGGGGGGGGTASRGGGVAGPILPASARTRASGHAAASTGAPSVGAAPVRTASSGAPHRVAAAPTRPVRTRTSGHRGDGGEHDD